MDDRMRRQMCEAAALYNRGLYLESQEAFERIHGECDAGRQALPRALLMVACAMHLHFRRGGGRGVQNLLRQSLVILDDLRPRCEGVDTEALYENLAAYLQELGERKRPGAGFFDRWLVPKIDTDG